MRFSGDFVICPSGFFAGIGIQMPTAVVRTYSGDGFVIAADGMACDQDNNVTSLEKQKIFPFGGRKSMAYSLAGRSMIGPDEGPEIWFDFRQEIDKAVQSISMSRDVTLLKYAERLRKRICRELTAKCPTDKIHFDDTSSPHPGEIGSTLTWLFIDGYYKGLESSVMIRFYRHEQRFEAETYATQIVRGAYFCHGSEIIHNLIGKGDLRFCNDRYFRPLDKSLQHLSDDILRAINYSRAYIEACASPEARELDPFCAAIGGRIHIATVKPKDGFDWAPGFEPEEA